MRISRGLRPYNTFFSYLAYRLQNRAVFVGLRAFDIGLGPESRARASGSGFDISKLGLGPNLSGSGFGLEF